MGTFGNTFGNTLGNTSWAPLTGGSGGAAEIPSSIRSKLAGWYFDNKDVLNSSDQDRTLFTQNSIQGQVFPGRAYKYLTSGDYSFVDDGGALQIDSSPWSLSFWVKFDTLPGSSSCILGRYKNASTNGEWAIFYQGGALGFRTTTSGGTFSKYILGTVSTGVWYHCVVIINSGYITAFANGVEFQTGGIAITGTWANLTSKFTVNGLYNGGTGNQVTGITNVSYYRDIRIFKGKALSATEINTLYTGGYVAGFTQWYMMSGNSLSVSHSAKFGGLHLTNVGFAAENIVTDYCGNPYNNFGYAEDATYGQIPPDMSNLTGGYATKDCYDNDLIFKNQAKIDLVVNGDTVKFYDSVIDNKLIELQNATTIISLNTWYSGNVSQAIDKSLIAQYCAGRQFYNAARNELVILKETSYLSVIEEQSLLNCMKVSASHVYHATTDTFIARLSGTYTAIEKSKIDNLFRLSIASGILAKLDLLYLTCLNNTTDKNLNWVSTSYSLTPAGDNGYIPNLGMYASDGGYFNTGFTPSLHGVNFLQDDALVSFKLYKNTQTITDNTLFYFGALNLTKRTYAMLASSNDVMNLSININSQSPVQGPITDLSKTYVSIRATSVAASIHNSSGMVASATSVTSTAPVDYPIYLCDANNAGNTYLPMVNYFQHYAMGGNIGAALAKLFARYVDWFCNQSSALTTEIHSETDYTYYLYDKLLLSINGNIAVYSDYKYLYYSIDLGVTYTRRMAFSVTSLGMPDFINIFDNGNILWTTSKNKCYLSTDQLQTYSEITPQHADGSPYVIHTPANAAYPGTYFRHLGPQMKRYIGAEEIVIWGNYGNSLSGANPANIWYSKGSEVISVYEFGQNPYMRDDGTGDGGITGTLLGDATNPVYCTHSHAIVQDPDNETDFYLSTGDFDRAGPVYECHVIKLSYNAATSSFDSTLIKSASRKTNFKSGFSAIINGYIYWASDADNTPPDDQKGCFRSPLAGLADFVNHERVYLQNDTNTPLSIFYIENGRVLSWYASGGTTLFGGLKLITSTDMVNYSEIESKVPGEIYAYHLQKISNNKYLMNIMVDYAFPKKCYSVIFEWK